MLRSIMKAVDWDVKPQTKNTNKHCGQKYFKLLTFLENIVDQIRWLLMKPADQDPQCFHPNDKSILIIIKNCANKD